MNADQRLLAGLAAIGVLATAAGLFVAPDRTWASWLLAGFYGVGLGLGGLCFVAIHYTTGSSWSVAIRRIAESLAGLLPFALLIVIAPLVVRPELYPWADGRAAIEGAASGFKQRWLSRPFFLGRAAAYSLVWIAFALAVIRASRRQDQDGDSRWTRANVRLSAAFLAAFAATFSLASVDWIMSLEPLWSSTVFGVYNFAGLFLSALAAIVVVALWLEARGPLQQVLTDEHLHDLGKLLFAFSTFWMYIWFSQYMLIWYTNIPDETAYFVARTRGWWFPLFVANVALNWLVPFAVLLGRGAKRARRTLGWVAAVVLVGRFVDLYLMIFPSVAGDAPRIGVWEIGVTAGALGFFGLVLAWILRGAPVVPVADPQLAESLNYES